MSPTTLADVLPAPCITDAMRPLLADETAWLLSRATQQYPLRVTIEQPWQEFVGRHRVEYFVDDRLVHELSIDSPDQWVFPLTATMSNFDTNRSGIYRLHYRAYLPVGTSSDSEEVCFNLDKEAPNFGSGGPELRFPAEVVRDGVTDDYLTAHGDQVIATIDPVWPDIRLEDVITVQWLREGASPAESQVLSTFVQVIRTEADKEGPIEVVFTGDFLRENGNGRFFVDYYLRDRAGNEGSPSRTGVANVDLTFPPTNLLRPLIPQADDGLIDRADACAGVWVVIPGYSVPKAGDEILLTFNTSELAPYPVTTPAQFPVRIELPWALLSAYDARDSAVVSYRVKRGTYISLPSPSLSFDIDVRIPGPPNPDPCPPNSALDLVRVQGAVSKLDNLILDVDKDQPALASVPLYMRPNAGETLTLYWGPNTVRIGTYTVGEDDVAGQPVTFPVPWSEVLPANGRFDWPVHYEISNGVNTQRSLDTRVAVLLGAGAGGYLPRVRFPGAYNDYIINCAYNPYDNGVRILLPGNAATASNVVSIWLVWSGYKGPAAQGEPVPAASGVFEVPVPAHGGLAALTYRLGEPQDTYAICKQYVEPLGYKFGEAGGDHQDGSAAVFYVVRLANGTLLLSDPREMFAGVSLVMPGGVCPCDPRHSGDEWCAPAA